MPSTAQIRRGSPPSSTLRLRRHRDRSQDKDRIGKLYAGPSRDHRRADEDLIDTSLESAADFRALRHTSGGVRLGPLQAEEIEDNAGANYARLIEVFQGHDIGYFFYNGAANSADTFLKFHFLQRRLGFRSQRSTCRRPWTTIYRLPTAARASARCKYVAVSDSRSPGFDVSSMARTSTKVLRHGGDGPARGWIAAAGGLAPRRPADGPAHIILFPK